MSANAWTAVTILSSLAAATSAVAAIGLHAADIDAGYRLARLRREAVELRRDARAVEQRVTALRAPSALLARARVMGLSTEYPEDVLEVHAADVRWHLREAESRVESFASVGTR